MHRASSVIVWKIRFSDVPGRLAFGKTEIRWTFECVNAAVLEPLVILLDRSANDGTDGTGATGSFEITNSTVAF